MALVSGTGKLQEGALAGDRTVLPPRLTGNIWTRIVRYYNSPQPTPWPEPLVCLMNLKVKVTTIVHLRLSHFWSAALSTSLSY